MGWPVITLHLLGPVASWYWHDGPKPLGSATELHGAALGYRGPIGVRVRWLWAITEALAHYEQTTGTDRAPGVRLCPERVADLRGFVAALDCPWPDEYTTLQAANLRRLDLRITVERATPEDLDGARRRGRDLVAGHLLRRAAGGRGVAAIVAGLG